MKNKFDPTPLFIAFLLLVIFGLSFCASGVKADENTYLYTGAWSKHLFDNHDYNEKHDLLALENEHWFGGYFNNSFGDESYALMYKPIELTGDNFRDHPLMENINIRVFFGGIYGYHDCAGFAIGNNNKLCPMVAPAVSYTKYRMQPSIIVLGNAVAISVRWEL